MRWILLGMICTTYDPQCVWHQYGVYRSEVVCVANGLSIDPKLQFKCVPEFSGGVPLPRPRPLALR